MVFVVMVFAEPEVFIGQIGFFQIHQMLSLQATPTIMPFRKAARSSSRIILRTRQIKRKEQGKIPL